MSDYTRRWAGSAVISYETVSNSGQLRYLKAGSGPGILLMHTLRTQLDYFQKLIPYLTEYFTVYAVDLPGLGWSEIRANAHYDEPAIRADIIEFIKKLDLDDFTIAGESMGATLSLSVACELGSQVNRVVALNTYDYPQGVERANLLASIVIKGMRIPFIGLLPSKLENELILSGVLGGGFYDSKKLPRDFIQELIKSGRRPGFATVETAYLRNLSSFIGARKMYRRVKAPVTLVYGDHDWSRPSERREVAQLMPSCRVITLPNAGHFLSLEYPQKVARILIDRKSDFET